MDSFDPRLWEKCERRLSLEPPLETENREDPINKEVDPEKTFKLILLRMKWASELRVHRVECNVCETNTKKGNPFGLDYFKGGNVAICMGIHDGDIGKSYCYYCDTALGDRETWLMEHKSCWQLRYFHAECAVKCNIITRKELMDSWPYITEELQKLMVKRAQKAKRYKVYSLK